MEKIRLTKELKKFIVELIGKEDTPMRNPYDNTVNIKRTYRRGIINEIETITPLYMIVHKSAWVKALTTEQFIKCVREYLSQND